MKRILLAILIVTLSAVPVFANPFLVCDPQTNVTQYVVTLDGVTTTVDAFDLGDGTVMLKFDLAGISNGNHDMSIKAKNIWEESIAVPFVFNKQAPQTPSGIGLSAE